MKKFLIVIGGIPASGKTTYGNEISRKLKVPIFSKDKFKEVIYDSIDHSKLEYEQKRKLGVTSYSVLYAVCEEMMKIGCTFIIESNFTHDSSIKINELLKKYHYKSIVIRFDADIKILHKRFLNREESLDRHSGLMANGIFDDFDKFKEMAKKASDFKLNCEKEILVDTGNFSKVEIEKVIWEIRYRIHQS